MYVAVAHAHTYHKRTPRSAQRAPRMVAHPRHEAPFTYVHNLVLVYICRLLGDPERENKKR